MTWKILTSLAISCFLLGGLAGGFIGHFGFPVEKDCPVCPNCVCGDCVCPGSDVQECKALSPSELTEICKDTVCQTRIIYKCETTNEEREELMNSSPKTRQLFNCMDHRLIEDCNADSNCFWRPYSIPQMDCSGGYGCKILPGQGTCLAK